MGSTLQLSSGGGGGGTGDGTGRPGSYLGLLLMLMCSYIAGHVAFAAAAPSPASLLWLGIYVANVLLNIAHARGWLPGAVVITLGAPVALLLPHVVVGDDQAALRGAVAMASLFYFTRLVACVRDPGVAALPLLERIAHVQMSFHDIRHCRRPLLPSRWPHVVHCLAVLAIDAAALVGGARLSAAAAGAGAGAGAGAAVSLSPSLVVVLAGAALQILGGLRAFGHVVELEFAFFAGRRVPALMCNVLGATSLRDFWGVRWNVVIQRSLKQQCYVPLRRRGWPRGFASAATFFCSGFLHVYPVWAATRDAHLSASMLAYFLSQAVLLHVEDVLGLQGWAGADGRGVLARVWTLAAVAAPLPLLVRPLLVGGHLS